MSTFTPNLNLELVARGGDVGAWDTPTNSNWSIDDTCIGGIANITVNNSNITLSAAQFQCRNLTFISTLTGSINVVFPSSFTKDYEIHNLATGSSAFTIQLSVSGGSQIIFAPPGQATDVFNDGVNMQYKNLPPVGSMIDFATTAVPAWISFCTVPPWLNCNGQSFSATTYPALAAILGGTTVPDTRGCVSAALDAGAGRLTGSFLQVIGSQTTTLGTANLPPYTPTGTVAITQGPNNPNSVLFNVGGANLGGGAAVAAQGNTLTISAAFTGNAQGGTSTPVGIVQPTTVVGIRMIRAG
jgi:microcystin-dependent protein